MLPATFQFIIAMLASALTDRLTKKMAYMREEQRILMEITFVGTPNRRPFAFVAQTRPPRTNTGILFTVDARPLHP